MCLMIARTIPFESSSSIASHFSNTLRERKERRCFVTKAARNGGVLLEERRCFSRGQSGIKGARRARSEGALHLAAEAAETQGKSGVLVSWKRKPKALS